MPNGCLYAYYTHVYAASVHGRKELCEASNILQLIHDRMLEQFVRLAGRLMDARSTLTPDTRTVDGSAPAYHPQDLLRKSNHVWLLL